MARLKYLEVRFDKMQNIHDRSGSSVGKFMIKARATHLPTCHEYHFCQLSIFHLSEMHSSGRRMLTLQEFPKQFFNFSLDSAATHNFFMNG